MPKIMLKQTEFHALRSLILQLRFGSPETLLEQTYCAEHLITLIQPEKQYPVDFICYKLTGFKPRTSREAELISGSDIILDLAVFVNQVTKQSPIAFEQLPEPATLTTDLVIETNISEKTISRWKKYGLVQRYVRLADGSLQTCILTSTWQTFITRHEKRVARAAAFSRLTPYQRSSIIRQARNLYQSQGLSRHQIELLLAEKTGRAKETIRYILVHHDKSASPEDQIFPTRTKFTEKTSEQIHEMFERGIPIDQLARIFGRSPSTIYRIIHQARASKWRQANIEYIFSPEFDLPSADQTILPALDIRISTGNSSERHGILSATQERSLFRLFNYLKWKQDQLRKPLLQVQDENSPVPADYLNRLDDLQRQVDQVKSVIILSNQALIVSIAKRHLNQSMTLDELFSEGLIPLMKSVEKFDYTKGFKFSTYASWSIMKHFARVVPLAGQQAQQLASEDDLDALMPGMTDVDEAQAYKRSMAVQTALDQLNDRERHVLENRYGLDRNEEPMSLSQLGLRFGLTKERIRQIETKAMDKMYAVLKESIDFHEE